ncbi:MAG: crosslink repair DNA glycosylase YcaQ family protein [Paenibacillaceae bacterium]
MRKDRDMRSTGTVLGKRALNRALLARQFLMERVKLSVSDVLEQLVGLQSQAPNPPYIGLWTRIEGFEHDSLSQLLLNREAVRIALMRSTIFLVY